MKSNIEVFRQFFLIQQLYNNPDPPLSLNLIKIMLAFETHYVTVEPQTHQKMLQEEYETLWMVTFLVENNCKHPKGFKFVIQKRPRLIQDTLDTELW